MQFRVKITGRIPFLRPIHLTPIDRKLTKSQTDSVAFLNGEHKTVRLGPYSIEVTVVIEPRA